MKKNIHKAIRYDLFGFPRLNYTELAKIMFKPAKMPPPKMLLYKEKNTWFNRIMNWIKQ